jgi:hypothetical protein
MKKLLTLSAVCFAALCLIWGSAMSQVTSHPAFRSTPITSQQVQTAGNPSAPLIADGGGWPPCCHVVLSNQDLLPSKADRLLADGGGWPPTHPRTGGAEV